MTNDDAKIVALYRDQGMTVGAIAKRAHRSTMTIKRILGEAGIQTERSRRDRYQEAPHG